MTQSDKSYSPITERMFRVGTAAEGVVISLGLPEYGEGVEIALELEPAGAREFARAILVAADIVER